MNIQYKAFLLLKASIKLQELRKPDRGSIVSFLKYLETNPFERGDMTLHSKESGTEYFMKGIRRRIVVYTVDHASKEIKVADIKHIDEA